MINRELKYHLSESTLFLDGVTACVKGSGVVGAEPLLFLAPFGDRAKVSALMGEPAWMGHV